MILRDSRLGSALPDSQREIVEGAQPRARANSTRLMPSPSRMVWMISRERASMELSVSNAYASDIRIRRVFSAVEAADGASLRVQK